MKLITNPIYQCDFCDKKLYKVGAMAKHENHCYKNPKNFAQCSECANCQEVKVEYSTEGYFDGRYFDQSHNTKGFHCTALNKDLYPYKCVRKGLVEKYPDTFEGKELMPSDGCKEFIMVF